MTDSVARRAAAFDQAVEALLVFDPDGRVTDVNGAACALLGYTAEQMIGHPVTADALAVVDEHGSPLAADGFPVSRALSRGESVPAMTMGLGPEPRRLWVNCSAAPLSGGGAVAMMVDITARVAAEGAARETEARWRAAFDHGPIGQALLDRDGGALLVNPALARLLGTAARDLHGVLLTSLVHPTEQLRVEQLLAAALAGAQDSEPVLARVGSDEAWRWTSWAVSPVVDGGGPAEVRYLVAQVIDVEENMRRGDQLRHAAAYDSLTGLVNRATATSRLHELLESLRPGGPGLAVFFVDLDGFKAANDSLGHLMGDRILASAAERLREVSRSSDLVARFGGDEFLVVVEGVGADDDLGPIAARLQSAFVEPLEVDGTRLALTASIGAAVADPDDPPEGVTALLRDADAAMYHAKRRGRARWQAFDDTMLAARVDRFALAAELRTALSRGDLRPHYQPVVDLATGEAVGAEALLRWHHPERGILSPAEFLEVIEESDLLAPVGWYVLEQAARAAAALGGTGWVSVNVSTRAMADAGFADTVRTLLGQAGLEPGRLVLEVTESALLEGGAVVDELTRLDALGVRIALDDFGTGYSSLTHLRALPVSILKLDRSLVEPLPHDPQAEAIAASVVQLAAALGVQAVAEGVESPEQAHVLAEMGCALGQGWLFGRPTADLHGAEAATGA